MNETNTPTYIELLDNCNSTTKPTHRSYIGYVYYVLVLKCKPVTINYVSVYL